MQQVLLLVQSLLPVQQPSPPLLALQEQGQQELLPEYPSALPARHAEQRSWGQVSYWWRPLLQLPTP